MKINSKNQNIECRLLNVIDGVHAKHYKNFTDILDHCKSALMQIATLEQIYHDVRPVSLPRIEKAVDSLLATVHNILECLTSLDSDDSNDTTSRYLFAILKSLTRNIRDELRPVFQPYTEQIDVPLDVIRKEHARIIGNKAANLATLRHEIGLTTPNGFAITATASIHFLNESGIAAYILSEMAELDPDNPATIASVSTKIKKRIMDEPLPPNLQNQLETAVGRLRGNGKSLKLAVRSSAIGEDSETSFAGQYESLLNVAPEDIAVAYKTVLSSTYSAAAISYRLQHGLDDRETPMGVLVLEMVDAVFSGVMYTADPVHDDTDKIYIAAVSGLGENLVGGQLMPMWSCILDKTSFHFLDKSLSLPKEGFFDKDGEGTVLAAELWSLAKRIDDALKRPQDIEWAVSADGKLHFLQSRPLMVVKKNKNDDEQFLAIQDELTVLLDDGICASGGLATGQVVLAIEEESPLDIPKSEVGTILVTKNASTNFTPVVGQISGMITDIGSSTSHLGAIAREFGVPALFGVKGATATLAQGQEVTLWASGKKVFSGIAEKLLRSTRLLKRPLFASPVHLRFQRVLDEISPLNMNNPDSDSFHAGECRTIHDIVRFSHEQAMQRMFGLGRLGDPSPYAVSLQTILPIRLHVLNLGNGFRANLTTCDPIDTHDVSSPPFQALWTGLSHPSLNWRGSPDNGASSFRNIKRTLHQDEEQPEGDCYLFVSNEYFNVEMRLGFHLATVGVLCGDDQDYNYIQLHFSGGSAPYFGRSLRAQYVSNVLERLGYSVILKGDLLEASLRRLPKKELLETLDHTGRLLGATRQLDMTLNSPEQILLLADNFFKESYGFHKPAAPNAPEDFYVITGDWSTLTTDHGRTILQDGSQFAPQMTLGVNQTMSRLFGKRYQDFLDTIEAYYYFPLAISKKGYLEDCDIEVIVRPTGGYIDQAGGVAFGIRDWNNYFVFRINALEDNAILFEFKNGKRFSRVEVDINIPSGDWHFLRVVIRGKQVDAFLNAQHIATHISEYSVHGHTGLWTKADSVTEFRDLNIIKIDGTTVL